MVFVVGRLYKLKNPMSIWEPCKGDKYIGSIEGINIVMITEISEHYFMILSNRGLFKTSHWNNYTHYCIGQM